MSTTKMTPYIQNSLTLGATANPKGDAEHLVLSQKSAQNLIEEAPKDGKMYARKDGAWVEIVSAP